ncbi:hypothetical protein BTR34_15635 [Maribacter hydrothermalis]|nr:hypothetical protein BTR34_15635 [Maribacter hydrothermalis]
MEITLMAMTIGLSMSSCIEPFVAEAVDFNSAIVIEATITDENKNQEILVSRTFALDTTGIYGERGAHVSVTDTNGAVYDFEESEEGKYISNVSFAAQAGLGYSLSVTTVDGSVYSSDEVVTPQPTQIDSVYSVRGFNNISLKDGMFIYIDSYDPTGANKYYRYTYEETYKIIPPFWSAYETFITTSDPLSLLVDLRPRQREERVCFTTAVSNSIIQESTTNFNQNRISRFPVRFISRENYILSHRYSILVKQYVQSPEAYAYFRGLNDLSKSGSIFSQIQTGFLEGNIKSEQNLDEEVVGFFEVSSVSEKRVFFNYSDYFPEEKLPPFIADCTFQIPNQEISLIFLVENEILEFFQFADGDDDERPDNGGVPQYPYVMVPTICGDCNVLGSNIKPDFWID